MNHPDPNDLVRKTAEKAMRNRVAMLETLAVKFLDETGLKPSECEMVEQTKDGQITWHFRKRVDPTVKDLLGFDIPGAHVEWTANGFNVVRPEQPESKYAQYVEPPADCAKCGQRKANHFEGKQGLCCECWVLSGNPPADWHSACMKAFAEKSDPVTFIEKAK